MTGIRITQFAGLLPEVSPKLLRQDHAQVAHNALLWDGQLKPMPAWTQVGSPIPGVTSLAEDQSTGIGFVVETRFTDLIYIGSNIEIYSVGSCGINNELASFNYRKPAYVLAASPSVVRTLGMEVPFVLPVQVITPQNQSVYPIARTYAFTYMSNNMESQPMVFPTLGADGTLFEGDFVTLTIDVFTSIITHYSITGFRLYRTVPGFDTSEELGNPRETKFHLVASFTTANLVPSIAGQQKLVYVDTANAATIQMDLLLTEQFQIFKTDTSSVPRLSRLESGWLVLAQSKLIQVSDRFLWHSWPEQNIMAIPDVIQDVTAYYDDMFIGTLGRPYHLHVENGGSDAGDSLSLVLRKFPDMYSCLPKSMVTTNFGAMYVSKDGMIELQANKEAVASKKILNPGDILSNPVYDIEIVDVTEAAWWNGLYLGLTSHAVGYLYNYENNSNNEFPLGQLVTYATPAGTPGPNLVIGQGLRAVWGNIVYELPLPGYGYEDADKQFFVWKSKKFVFPGTTNFSAAKVVHTKPTGFELLTFYLYGDGTLIQQTVVTDSKPFRVNHQHSCIEFEIVLEGDAVVSEVHVVPGMRDLAEEEGHA